MVFSKSTVNDLEDYCRLREDSIIELARLHYSQDQLEDWAYNVDKTKLKAFFAEGDFVLGRSSSGVLTCAGTWSGDEITNLYVSPAFSRQGWGRRLLTELEADFKLRAEHPYIRIDASNNAHDFYAANGYEFVSIEQMDIPGRVPYSYCRMIKYL